MRYPHRHWMIYVMQILLGGFGDSPTLANLTLHTGADLTLNDGSPMEIAS